MIVTLILTVTYTIKSSLMENDRFFTRDQCSRIIEEVDERDEVLTIGKILRYKL